MRNMRVGFALLASLPVAVVAEYPDVVARLREMLREASF